MMDKTSAREGSRSGDFRGHAENSGHTVCGFLRQVVAFGRVMRIYAEGHRRLQENMRQLKDVANQMLMGHQDGLDFTVRASGLRVDGQPVHQEPALVEAFCEILRVRGIRIMILRPGVTEEELYLLADLLSRDARELRAIGGADSVLSEELHPHFNLLASRTVFGGVGNDDEQGVPVSPDAVEARNFEELLGEQGEGMPAPGEIAMGELDAGFDAAEDGIEPDVPAEVRLVYSAVEDGEFGARSPHLLAVAEETLARQSHKHDAHGVAALIVCDLVGRAQDPLEYRARRDLLCDIVREQRLDVTAMRIAQLHMAGDHPDWPQERPAGLVLELGAIAGDVELLESALGRYEMPKAEARAIMELLALRSDAFHLLTVLLRAQLPDSVRVPIEDAFVKAVTRDKAAFRNWALDHPEAFFQKACFGFLLKHVDFVLGPIVKEVLSREGGDDRDRVIDMLVEDGSHKSLRLLVMGVRYAGDARDPRLIRAFGKFQHPLAVAILREIVHRANTLSCSGEEASSAVKALAQAGTDDALDFLDEVANKRVALLPLYRRSIRHMAQEAIFVA